MKRIRSFVLLILVLSLLSPARQAFAAGKGYASVDSIKNISGLTCRIKLTVNDRQRTFLIYKQTGQKEDYTFLRDHGCTTCILTTLLNSYKGYRFTPAYVHKKLIPRKLGRRATSMPIKLYGMHKILKKYHLYSRFIPRFSKARAREDIKDWLKKGGQVVVTVKSGKEDLWTHKHHSMILLGLKRDGIAIIGDSAQENHMGNLRIKEEKLNKVIKYMIPCTSKHYTYCWPGTSTAGGYIKCKMPAGKVKKISADKQ